MVQTVSLKYSNKNNNPLDALGYFHAASEAEVDIYSYDRSGHDRTDFVIYSLHSVVPTTDKHGIHRIAVVSYVPEINSEEWPQFYLNLCLAPILACDSVIAEQLKGISYPAKRIINLDGINPLAYYAAVPSNYRDDAVTIGCVQRKAPFWETFKEHLKKTKNEQMVIFKPVEDIRLAMIAVSFEPLGQLLSNTLSATRRVWLVNGPGTLYLDSRLTHNYYRQISQINSMAGGVTAQLSKQLMETMVEELTTLLAHAVVSPVPEFTSSATLISRIMNEVNKTSA